MKTLSSKRLSAELIEKNDQNQNFHKLCLCVHTTCCDVTCCGWEFLFRSMRKQYIIISYSKGTTNHVYIRKTIPSEFQRRRSYCDLWLLGLN